MSGFKRSSTNSGAILSNDTTGYEQALKQNRTRERQKGLESAIAMLIARINDMDSRLKSLESEMQAVNDGSK